MKNWAKFKIIAFLSVLIGGIVFSFASLPEPEYRIGEDETNPGKRTYWFETTDPCGNYEGNYTLVKIDVNGPGGISGGIFEGLSVWNQDPNYLVVDSAKYDPNSSDPNLCGIFSITWSFRHYDYQIKIQVFDQAGNNTIGEMIVNSRDRGRPRITDFGKEK